MPVYDPTQTVVDVLRNLVPKYSELFFEAIPVLQETCLNLVERIPLVRTFTEWYHPDIFAGDDVASSPFFVELSEAILSNTGNDFVYTGKTNTHWSNWPESGTL